MEVTQVKNRRRMFQAEDMACACVWKGEKRRRYLRELPMID